MKKIIHFHFHTDQNIGDAAVVYAIKDLLEAEYNISKYTSLPIFNLSNFEFGKFYKEELLEKNLFFRKLYQYNLVKNVVHSFLKIGEIFKDIYKEIYLVSLINSHDLMIIGGGGVYSKWTLPFDTKLINKIKIPIVVFGAGYNHNFADIQLSKEELYSIKVLHDKAKLCSVRDEKTLKFIKSLKAKATLIGDPAIFLKSTKVNLKFDKKVKKIGLNIAGHEKHVKVYTDKIINIYATVIKKLESKYNLEVIYLKHSRAEFEVAKKLKKRLPYLRIYDYGPRKTKYIYENLDLVISMMLHSSIFAYGSDKKFINIAYDVKNYAFMKLINNMDNLIDVRELEYETLYNKSLKLLKENYKNNKIVDKKLLKSEINSFVKSINTFIPYI